MIIILEGEDGAGKSTLADMIESRFHSRRRVVREAYGPPSYDPDSSSSYQEQVYLQHMRLLDEARLHPQTVYVIDRFHWGTIAYGRVFRPERDLDGWGDMGRERFLSVETAVAQAGGITVYVTNDLDTLAGRIASRGDEFLKVDASANGSQIAAIKDKLAPVRAMYDTLMRERLPSKAPIVARLSTPNDTLDVAECIITLARRRAYLTDTEPLTDNTDRIIP